MLAVAVAIVAAVLAFEFDEGGNVGLIAKSGIYMFTVVLICQLRDTLV